MLSQLPKKIKIVEVGARDGLQNESSVLSTEHKLQFIERLVRAGLTTIEATSFVRADRIPQMADAKALFAELKKTLSFNQIAYPCLVPNLKGLEEAQAAGVKEIAVFTSTSESFNQKNINASIDESLTRIEQVMQQALAQKLRVRAYISTVFGCPYEGATSLEMLVKIAKRLVELGAYEISLGDTTGVGNPRQVVQVTELIKKHFRPQMFAMHFHDTCGMALANILTSLEQGMTTFDASAGGLGGCPYAKGATGNVATEDLVYLCHSLGVETGVNMELLAQASEFILGKLNKPTTSKYLQFYLKKAKRG